MKEYTIAEILSEPTRNGLTKPKAIRGVGVPMISMREIFAHSRIANIEMDRVPVTDKELESYSINAGDIVFARQSLTLAGAGKCSIITKISEPTVFESHLIRMRINTEIADPYYVYYYFNSYEGKNRVKSIVEQVAAAGIRSSDLVKLKIFLPSKDTQSRIAGILNKIDTKIETNNEINKNLFQQAQVFFKHYFIDMIPFDGTMPDNWHLGTVSEIIELHDSKRIPLSSRQRDELEKIYPYYGAASIMDYVDRYLFDGVYLLLGEDGTVVDSNGFPILQYVDGKFWVNNHAHIITGKNGFSVELLYLLFSLTKVQSIVTGAVQPKISQGNLKKISVIIPSESMLKAFDKTIQPIFAQIRNLRAENKLLETTRDTLLPKLMSGELDVSNLDL